MPERRQINECYSVMFDIMNAVPMFSVHDNMSRMVSNDHYWGITS